MDRIRICNASYLEHEKNLDLTAEFLGITVERLEELLKKS